MAVSLKPRWTKQQVHDLMQKERERLVKAVLLRLVRIGEQFVSNARSKTAAQGGFRDRTGNLRNSIGYVVLNNGAQYRSDFKTTVSGGSAGASKAQAVASDVAGQFPSGLVLIVVAGMEYASAVESRGRDVITGSSLAAKNELRQAIIDLRQKLNTRAL
jgi:hypothetical protein